MSKLHHIRPDEARLDPEAYFESPTELVAAPGLNRGERLATLDRWEQQLRDRLDATAEGMPSHGDNDRDIRTLELIVQARAALAA